MLSILADILAPRACVGCAEEGSWLCAACLTRVTEDQNAICAGCERLSPCGTTCDRCRDHLRLRSVTVTASHDDPIVRQLVHLVKYARASDVASAFAVLVQRFAPTSAGIMLRQSLGAKALIIPVPLAPVRERDRGFNQSELLARVIAAAGYGIVAPYVLRRVWQWPWNASPPQAGLPRAQRLTNVRDAFRCPMPHAVRGSTLLLVDDVVTTAATMSACAHTLRDAGAHAVHGFAIARG